MIDTMNTTHWNGRCFKTRVSRKTEAARGGSMIKLLNHVGPSGVARVREGSKVPKGSRQLKTPSAKL